MRVAMLKQREIDALTLRHFSPAVRKKINVAIDQYFGEGVSLTLDKNDHFFGKTGMAYGGVCFRVCGNGLDALIIDCTPDEGDKIADIVPLGTTIE